MATSLGRLLSVSADRIMWRLALAQQVDVELPCGRLYGLRAVAVRLKAPRTTNRLKGICTWRELRTLCARQLSRSRLCRLFARCAADCFACPLWID